MEYILHPDALRCLGCQGVMEEDRRTRHFEEEGTRFDCRRSWVDRRTSEVGDLEGPRKLTIQLYRL